MTYNLLLGRAERDIAHLVEEHRPDFLCLQEFDTTDPHFEKVTQLGYKLAGYSNTMIKWWGKIYGVTTFYSEEFEMIRSPEVINLSRGLDEIIFFLLVGRRRQRTVLKTQFRRNSKSFTLYNVHLSPFTTNKLREKQMHQVFQDIKTHSQPTVVLGDFNYPYRRRNFEAVIHQYGFHEATTEIFKTFTSKLRIFPFKFKLDYVLFKHITHIATKKFDTRYSDHNPLISTFEIN